MNASMRCGACGMLMTHASLHANSDPANPYCIYCTDLAGNLKPRDEIREGMIHYVMKSEDLPRPKAETEVDRQMATLPAWRAAS